MTDSGTALLIPSVSGLSELRDSAVMALSRELAVLRREVDAAAACVAGELAHRSRVELGYAGLAQRNGARTAEKLVQQLTGSTLAEARTLVHAGETLAGDAPWLSPVTAAVRSGDVSVGALDAVRIGLGAPSGSVAADDLLDAANRLAELARTESPERLIAASRAARDELDPAAVTDREHHLRARRYLRLSPQSDGMTRISGLLDPESAAQVVAAIDQVTSPRRGGPRFVDPAAKKAAQAIVDDERSTEQIALDALVEMVRLSCSAEDRTLYGSRVPSVRVHVTLADLERRAGHASLEGQSTPVSVSTAERMICNTGVVPVLFDRGQTIDVGRDQRLFTSRQRIALAARDGGCRFPGCDRPPSWCEAHHIVPWSHSSKTEVRDGILLCRHHHMLVHDNGWQVLRRGSDYVVRPPLDVDPDGVVRKMPSRSEVRVTT
jgi:hypothetical protein